MPNDDTIKLLNECTSGIKMAVESIEEVTSKSKNPMLSSLLQKYLNEHKTLGEQIQTKLNEFHVSGKEPSPIATAMSWLTTNFKLSTGDVDKEIADIMTDGCNMGIKSIAKYLNQYPTAQEDVKVIAKQLLKLEEDFMIDLRSYL